MNTKSQCQASAYFACRVGRVEEEEAGEQEEQEDPADYVPGEGSNLLITFDTNFTSP